MGKTILVVDDEADTLQWLSLLLRQEGYQPITASSGPEAIATVGRLRPDLILLDLAMPEMDGFDSCRALLARMSPHPAPIIVFTALDNFRVSAQCLSELFGIQAFLFKPLPPSALLACIQGVLEQGAA
ncbi:MAG: response regulator [Planctomycetes bacterium]|nr:response regulator [Planctomycetota bacterium]